MNLASYTQGNLAVKEPYRQQTPKIQRNAKQAPSPKTLKLSALEKLFYIAIAVVFTLTMASLVLLNSQTYSINKEILETKNSIKMADVTGGELKKKLAEIKNPNELSTAAAEANLSPVTENQKPSHQPDGLAANE